MSLKNELEEFNWKDVKSFYEFHEIDIDGIDRKFEKYKGYRVMVIFATSTNILMKDKKCNPHIPGDCTGSLIFPKVLFFPCNEFHNEKPGLSLSDVKAVQYECHFAIHVFPKVQIQAENAYSLWKWLNAHTPKTVNPDITELDRVVFYIDANGRVESRANISKASVHQSGKKFQISDFELI